MSFTVESSGDVTVVVVAGELIVGNRQEFKQGVLENLDQRATKFVIDFADCGYIDSSGLGVLVTLGKKIRERGGELRLAGLNEDLLVLMELTRLDTLFNIADSRAEALQGF